MEIDLTGNQWKIDRKVVAPQLESNVETGTAPLVVASTTMVANLNVEQLGGVAKTGFLRVFRTTVTGHDATPITVTHNLNVASVAVTVFDENGLQILMDEVELTSADVVTLYKSSYGSVAGTWKILVAG